MLLKCHRPALTAALLTVSGVVPSRTPKEVLKNIKLAVNGGKTTLIGTDQEIGIRHEVGSIEAESDGDVLLPAARVVSILREMTDDVVTLDVTDRNVMIRGERSEFKLSVEDPAEFPNVAEFNEADYFVIPAKTLKEMIRRTIFACDTDSSRYALGGILVEAKQTGITLAATDSRRLAVMSGDCQTAGNATSRSAQPVVPSKAMGLIERSLPDTDVPVMISIDFNAILIKCNDTTIYSRLIEGRFPRYADVIPSDFTATIDIPAGSLYAAVKQSQIVTSEESRGVDFAFGKGELQLSSRAADVGQSQIVVPIAFDGRPMTVTLDPSYVAGMLKILDASRNVSVNIKDEGDALLLSTSDGYRYVVMPLSRDSQ